MKKIIKHLRKRWLQYGLETLMVFIGILGAFTLTNWKENNKERKQYSEALLMFAKDLDAEVTNWHFQIDSFKITSHMNRSGKLYEKLINLLWLDSLIKHNTASMDDFEYIIQAGYLNERYVIDEANILFSSEIRSRYAEHAHNNVKRFLRQYEIIMRDINKRYFDLEKANNNLNILIEKTNPDLVFDSKDSLIFYSTEFQWRYSKFVSLHLEEYQMKKELVEDFDRQAEEIGHELSRFGIEIPESVKCYKKKNFKDHYECAERREINSDNEDIIYINDYIIQKRQKYLTMLRNTE